MAFRISRVSELEETGAGEGKRQLFSLSIALDCSQTPLQEILYGLDNTVVAWVRLLAPLHGENPLVAQRSANAG